MKAVRICWVAAVALMLGGGAALAGMHEPPPSRTPVRRIAPRPTQVSMYQAVRLAQRRFRAQVVRVETQTEGGRTIYVLRMLDGAGRVFAVRVDAASGAIL